jgi:hypothetical protein
LVGVRHLRWLYCKIQLDHFYLYNSFINEPGFALDVDHGHWVLY